MENEINARKIICAWHFTKIEKLAAILNEGLIPRETLEARNANIDFNDQHRLDGYRNANCLSIGHPNYKMFYRLRQANTDQEWVVIAIKPQVLWEKDCAFCHQNAASNNVTSIPLNERKGLEAFEKLFLPEEGKPDRATLNIPDCCPTNPQAEVLVFDVIEPEYIIGAIVPSKERGNALTIKHPDFIFEYHRAHYSARTDYIHWK